MSIARKIGNVADVLDSAATGDFFAKGSADGQFQEIAYSSLVGTPTAIDSALTTQLIDSSYVQLRQTANSAGIDSALTIQLIDSSYVAARSSSSGSSGFDIFNYTATNNQTTFQDSSNDGTVLSYTENGILVYYNGLLLADEDFTATSGSSVVLASGADSGASLAIAKWSLGGGSGSSAVWYGDRGIVSGGEASGKSNVIEYFDITTPGNATDFGDLHAALGYHGGLSDTTYGIFAGGNAGSGYINNIQYITISTTGNTTDFGDMTTARGLTCSGCCNGTYGLWGATSGSNVIDRITTATPGNATDHGDLTRGAPSNGGTGACASATNGIFVGGGGFLSVVNNIDYVAFATAANTTDWGDLAVTRGSIAASSNDTTAVFMGGGDNDGNAVNIIEYMSTASTGNASDFGDLTTARKPDDSGSANATRAVCCGGNSGGTKYNTIDYVTIATPGNATDFGDCAVSAYSRAGCSGSAS